MENQKHKMMLLVTQIISSPLVFSAILGSRNLSHSKGLVGPVFQGFPPQNGSKSDSQKAKEPL